MQLVTSHLRNKKDCGSDSMKGHEVIFYFLILVLVLGSLAPYHCGG